MIAIDRPFRPLWFSIVLSLLIWCFGVTFTVGMVKDVANACCVADEVSHGGRRGRKARQMSNHIFYGVIDQKSLYIKYCLFTPGRATSSSTSESRLLYAWHVSPLTKLIVLFNHFVRSGLCVSKMVLYTDWSAIMIGPFQSGPFQINSTLLLNTMSVANFQSSSLPLYHHRFWFLQMSTN